MEPKGDITHKIIEANVFLPIVMQDLSDPYSKVMWLAVTSGRDVFYLNERHSWMSNHSVFSRPFSQASFKMQNIHIYSGFSSLQALKLIEGLADANKYSLNKDTTVDSIKVYQLLRLLKYEQLGNMWKALKEKDEQRSATLCSHFVCVVSHCCVSVSAGLCGNVSRYENTQTQNNAHTKICTNTFQNSRKVTSIMLVFCLFCLLTLRAPSVRLTHICIHLGEEVMVMSLWGHSQTATGLKKQHFLSPELILFPFIH